MKRIIRDQYMMFDGIKLVSVYSDEFPFDNQNLRDLWHVPGRRILGTDQLMNLAHERGVTLNHTIYRNGIATITALI